MLAKRCLSRRVTEFAREYVQLVEALMHEGVPEEMARYEARIVASAWLMEDARALAYDPATGPCPTCSRG